MWQNVFFNAVDLAALAGVSITKVQFHNRPKRATNRKKLARADGSRLINSEYDTKVITVEGVIRGDTKPLFEQNRDMFFKYIEPTEATFSVQQGGETRNYQASVDETSWTQEPLGSFGIFAVGFVCSYPFSESTGYITALNSTGNTLFSFSKTFNAPILGSYKCQPVISITVTSASTANVSDSITITDPLSGKSMTLTRVWAAGDIAILDSSAHSVTVNGVTTDFTGVFIELAPGSNYINYEDTFSISRSVGLRVEYKKRNI
jgi:hypothetical protein